MDIDEQPEASTSAAPVEVKPDPDAPAESKPEQQQQQEPTTQPDSESDSDESDSDDPVLKTIPVYFTPALSKHTSLLCYPHKKPDTSTPFPLLPPSMRDVDHARQTLARAKPNVGRLEMSVPLEVQQGTESRRFNVDKAKHYRQGVDARDLGASYEDKHKTSAKRRAALEGDVADEKPLERISMRGEAVPDQTNYCIGILKDEQLHLTPLTQTVQLRPDLTYLDRLTTRSKSRPGAGGDNSDGGSDNEGAANDAPEDKKSAAASKAKAMAEGAKAVNVAIKEGQQAGGAAGAAGGVATGRQDGSLFAPLRAEEAEEWVDLNVYPPTDEQCNEVWEALFSRRMEKLECVTGVTDAFPEGH